MIMLIVILGSSSRALRSDSGRDKFDHQFVASFHLRLHQWSHGSSKMFKLINKFVVSRKPSLLSIAIKITTYKLIRTSPFFVEQIAQHFFHPEPVTQQSHIISPSSVATSVLPLPHQSHLRFTAVPHHQPLICPTSDPHQSHIRPTSVTPQSHMGGPTSSHTSPTSDSQQSHIIRPTSVPPPQFYLILPHCHLRPTSVPHKTHICPTYSPTTTVPPQSHISMLG